MKTNAFCRLLMNSVLGRHKQSIGQFRLVLAMLLFSCGLNSSTAVAATLPSGFTETLVASGLTAPTAMAFAPDGRLFVCQQGGQLRVIKNGALLPTPFVTLNVDSAGERGLLGVAFDPGFATNGFVYVYYTATTPAIHNRVSRFIANGDVAVAGSEAIILDLNNLSSATNHNGGAIHFGPDLKLYIAVGENANSANSQSLANLLGKTLRINSDGTIPSDNPTTFPGISGSTTGINRAIWAVGLRNPFTFTFQPGTGRLFINDVGQNTWKEINDGIAGSNYGWPTCEGACTPTNANLRDPLFQYGHGATSTTGCAIVGAAFYNPSINQFGGDYPGKYFFADLCTGWIRRFDPATNTASNFASGVSTPVDLKVWDDGSLYYLAQGGGGTVFKVQRTPTAIDTFQFTSSTFSASESNPIVTISVRRIGTASTTATVDYSTSNGTALGTGDYTTATGTLHFNPGDTIQTFTVLITDDAYAEGDETVNLSLGNPTGQTILGTSSTATLTITDNDAGAPATNPSDDAQFFVRQHYYDFLDRAPDQGGLAYWTQQIAQCGADQSCVNRQRIGVSGAFFVENEFQQTGQYIYLLYKESFGALSNAPNRANMTFWQYIADHGQVIAGPQLDQSKTDFANAFVIRRAFTTRYPNSMTTAEFVDALNANTSGALTQSERDALVNGLINGTETRGSVVRKIAENQAFIDHEYNASFVLAEYFNYLRRDPDQGGYDFWLNQLNRYPLRDLGATRGMVCSFITSPEYQIRFSSVMTHSNAECQP